MVSQKSVSIDIHIVDMTRNENARPVADEYGVNYTCINSYETDNKIEQVAIARDRGIQKTNGRYVLFLDDDDEIQANGIRMLLEAIESGDCSVAFARKRDLLDPEAIREFYTGENPIDPDTVLEFCLSALAAPYGISGMLAERSAIESLLPMADFPHDDIVPVIELVRSNKVCTIDRELITSRSGYGLSRSVDCKAARMAIVEYYDELYDAYPDTVRKRGLALKHAIGALKCLQQSRWSAHAVRHFWKAVRTNPDGSPYGLVFASLFGRYGLRSYKSRFPSPSGFNWPV
ncbi:hypothetical protein A6E15_07570 [Natrinema saccharevitans]|uniref:Glycosyltransferase 2-like domain-containing protein n=1 Tax=Natrinema saccharevitans TaxID=301967 RepID=A0A1S8AW99_9EURY|nr:hypothetical protein A6E15_07570 [Natrinema saccharevitans]